MKTFLDTHRDYSSSFILYGHINDTIWCGDLSQRTTEQYLVKLLKSRGVEHVIFYGDPGNRGAFCLDPVSARFFFAENAALPVREVGQGNVIEDDGSPEGQQTVGRATPAAGTPMGRNRRRRERTVASDTTEGHATTAEGEGQPTSAEVVQTPPRQRVVYARKSMKLEFFLQFITPLMNDPKSHMAVVFYNVFTSEFGAVQTLRDSILTMWEQLRTMGNMRNLCLILAPDTQYNTDFLVGRINAFGLAPRFLATDSNGHQYLNPHTCIEINLPKADEVRNLLRRLAIVGTDQTYRKITFAHRDLDDIVTEVVWCSRSVDGHDNADLVISSAEYMEQIETRLKDYVNAQPGIDPVQITPDIVDEAWGRPRRDREPALEKLNRPGWEHAYEVIKQTIEACEASMEHQSRQELDGPRSRMKVDWAVERISSEPPKHSPRPKKMPHFALLGNPGTGKSTIARLIGDILREHGILEVGSTVEVTRGNLTSSYVAGIPRATIECVNRAEEGVLFVDEAHSLGVQDGGVNRESTGKEVLSTLVHAMTDGRHHFSLVLAGYEKHMWTMLNQDEGLRSRIMDDHIIVIDDYGPDLLEHILVQAVEAEGFTFDPALVEERAFEDVVARPLSCYVTRLYQTRDRVHFGNAREMENIAQKACARAEHGVVTEACFYEKRHDGSVIDHEWFEPSDVGNSLEHVIADIRERYVGLDSVEKYFVHKSDEINEALATGLTEDDIPLKPVIIRGEAGTGKTEVAMLMGRLFYHLHLIGTPEPIVVNCSELASSLQGGSQEKVLKYVREAQDKKALLFIDEAHQLTSDRFDGSGALKAFLNPLTDRAHPFMAVFAVYPGEQYFDRLVSLDSGFRRRFEIVDLPTYTGEQLFDILHKMMERQPTPLITDDETDHLLKRVCDYIYTARNPEQYKDNAGGMKNLLDDMNVRRRSRCRGQGIELGTPEASQFVAADIPSHLIESLPPEEATPEQLMAELDQLIGLDEVKRVVRGHIARVEMNRTRKARGMKVVKTSMHMVFTGNPGTGKTTVARLIGRIYQSIGVLPRGQVNEVDRSTLVGGYVGQTAIKTSEEIQKALGGVLFVDEAYSLTSSESPNDFGPEAVDTILKAMEDYRDNLAVIVAGYPGPMSQFISSNSGLKSRFKTFVNFPNYSVDECIQILEGMCQGGGYLLTDEAREAAHACIQREVATNANFSNGRFVRNLFEEAISAQAERLVLQPDPTDEDLATLTSDDFIQLEHKDMG